MSLKPKQIGLRLPEDLLKRVDELVRQYPFATHTALVLEAVRLGLPALESKYLHRPLAPSEEKRRKAS